MLTELATREEAELPRPPQVLRLAEFESAQLIELLAESGHEELQDPEMVQEKMRAFLKRFFRKRLNRRPMILPVVWEM